MNDIVISDFNQVLKALGKQVHDFEDKNILITGFQGFLGSNFTAFFSYLNKKILKQKANITCIDNKIVALEDLTKGFTEGFQIIEGDVYQNLPDIPFDYVIHCAGIASPTYYRKFPLDTIYVNAISYWHLLNKINMEKMKGFLYFSTSEIYGDPDKNHIPTKENYRGNVSCVGPRACYDESKRLGETISESFVKEKKVPIKIVRPFNVYGPFMRLDDKRVIPDFVKFAFKDRMIQIFSDGSPTRSFCYISDALEGFIRVLLIGEPGQSYNIGNDSEEISILELAQMVSDIIGEVKIKTAKSNDINYLTDNPKRRFPNINKARKDLDYYPKVAVKTGLERAINWYKETYNLYVEGGKK